jgi:L-2-hydroxyglutarate oxidase LhgO
VLERSSRRRVDFVVVGAGLVGCAVTRELALAGRSVVMLDRAEAEGRGVSSRNSGVIHSGIFGKPGTRKQRSCVRGKQLLYDFAKRMEVDHQRCGKLVLARTAREAADFESRLAAARAAKIPVELLSATKALELEPSLEGASIEAALLLPDAGIVDPHQLCAALLREALDAGAFFAAQADGSSAAREVRSKLFTSSTPRAFMLTRSPRWWVSVDPCFPVAVTISISRVSEATAA